MPLTPLQISAQSEQELLTICEQPLESLEEAYSRLRRAEDYIISPKALRSALEHPLVPGVALVLAKQLVALQSYVQESGKTPAEIIGSLSLGIERKTWPEPTKKKWRDIAPLFEKFLAVSHIIVTTKALELSFDFEHLLTSINILTDIRPVYSATRNEIAGGIICNRLRIKFQDQGSFQSLSLSIDKDEIEKLRVVCGDALKKIELAAEMLNKKAKLQSFVTGEEYDGI